MMIFEEDEANHEAVYNGVMLYRRLVIAVSSIALLINIIVIIRQKQYVYNTIKLLLLVEIFYLISLVSVLPHHASMNLSLQMHPWIPNTTQIGVTVQNMISDGDTYGHPFWCAAEGIVNLWAYNYSYFFAIMIAIYVNRVLNNTHKNFMRRHIKMMVAVGFAIAGVFAYPFYASLYQGYSYSFGPSGFYSNDHGLYRTSNDNDQYYFFYCGLVNRNNQLDTTIYVLLFMGSIPVFLFGVHAYFLYKNCIGRKGFDGEYQLNPRQWFIIKSGFLSTLIFGIQFINVLKLGFSFIDTIPTTVISWALNIGFDLLPLGIVIIYFCRYYRKGVKIGMQGSLIRDTDSLISNDFAI